MLPARPVTAPPSADPDAATVDLYYEIRDGRESGNIAASLRPLERVAVALPLRSEKESLVVPWAAVLHDSQGGTWVYEMTEPQTYVRRRVQVRFVLEDVASLENGPEPGAEVVADGAAEIFGTEFGVGK
jgi:hypothetical protein